MRQLCAGMRKGQWRDELEHLQTDLANGLPFPKALAARKLPEFYKEMVTVGVEGNDLPGVLILLADYYHKLNSLWVRLQGLIVYPVTVLICSFALSCFLLSITNTLRRTFDFLDFGYSSGDYSSFSYVLWKAGALLPVIVLGMVILVVLAVVFNRRWRQGACWWLPAFKEAHLSRLASSLSLMIKSGSRLDTALALARRMEDSSPLGLELAECQSRLAQGHAQFAELGAKAKVIPPLFFWLAGGSGEDLQAGLARAAQVYHDRAVHKCQLMLYSVLPVSMLALGAVIVIQVVSVLHLLFRNMLSLVELG